MSDKIPVTVTADFKARVENFVKATKACISPSAASGVSRSLVCQVAIEELLERYEKTPEKMARKLGFAPVRQK
jgi:hypothetical protein